MFSTITKATGRTLSLVGTSILTKITSMKEHNKITDGLFLGMIPIKTSRTICGYGVGFQNHDIQIIDLVKKDNADRPLRLVVSAVTMDELKGEGFGGVVSSMVEPSDWKAAGVEQHIINIPDETADVTNEEIIYTIHKIRKYMTDGYSVYVHCKAGKSRSATLCAIYLALYGSDPKVESEMSLEEAIKLLQKQRPQVDIKDCQRRKALEVICEMKTMRMRPPLDMLKLERIKQSIAEMKEIGELSKHTTKPGSYFFSAAKPTVIPEFLKLLKTENNRKWLFEMMHPEGLLSSFIKEAIPRNEERKQLVERIRHQTIQKLDDDILKNVAKIFQEQSFAPQKKQNKEYV